MTASLVRALEQLLWARNIIPFDRQGREQRETAIRDLAYLDLELPEESLQHITRFIAAYATEAGKERAATLLSTITDEIKVFILKGAPKEQAVKFVLVSHMPPNDLA